MIFNLDYFRTVINNVFPLMMLPSANPSSLILKKMLVNTLFHFHVLLSKSGCIMPPTLASFQLPPSPPLGIIEGERKKAFLKVSVLN